MLKALVIKKMDSYQGGVERSLRLPLYGEVSEYRVDDVEGLGPSKANINLAELAQDSGAMDLSSLDEVRNIVLTLGFSPNYGSNSDISSLRQSLYHIMAPGMVVEIDLEETNLGVLTITGRVETLEPSIFSADPQVVISIICAQPYFEVYDHDTTLVLNTNLSTFTVDYDGTAPTGFTMILRASAAATATTAFKITNNTIGESMGHSGVSRVIGDFYIFKTKRGERNYTRLRAGVEAKMNGYLLGSLTGMRLNPGLNYFSLVGSTTFDQVEITYNTLLRGL